MTYEGRKMKKEYDANLVIESTLGGKDVNFFDAKCEPFRLYGMWHDGEKYCRMPKEVAAGVSKGIANNYGTTSGGRVRFITDSPYVAVKVIYEHIGHNDVTPLSATAAIEMNVDGEFGGVFRTPDDFREGELLKVVDIRGEGEHLITLYMPTHSEIKELYIGVAPGTEISHAPDYKYEKPVVFYGSSITHGTGCSRAGNPYPAQVSKNLDTNFVNLGFGGLAKGEAAMAEYIATLEMSAFVYDYDFNSPSVEHLDSTHEPFFKIIREKQPNLPIIITSRPSAFRTGEEDTAKRFAVIKKTYDNAVAAGDKNVYLLCGLDHFGEFDCECLVDGTHPNDFGYRFMAEQLGECLKNLI